MYFFLARNYWRSSSGYNSGHTKRFLTLSSVQGPLHPPLETKTLSQYFQSEILQSYSSRPALICRKELPRAHHGPPSKNLGVASHLAWDFEELVRHSNALARGLLGMGVRKGDRVGVVMGNNRSAMLSRNATSDGFECQCICYASVGLRKHRGNSCHSQSCVSLSRTSK